MARRILVIGCPCSGKARWRADRTRLTREELVAVHRPIPASSRWIIDGNCNDTMTLRVEACEAVIFLEDPPEVCLAGMRACMGKPRADGLGGDGGESGVTPRKAARRRWR